MKITKKAVSLVEAVIMTLIISLWLVWVYSLYSNSIKFLDWVETKIQAIQIAREWIEAVENIRDTNYKFFSSNTKNCWNTLNYDGACIAWWWKTMSGNYKIYRDTSKDNRWYLEKNPSSNTLYNNSYINFYKVWLDDKWLYNQTWSLNIIWWQTQDRNNFTRRIEIKKYASDDKITIKSIVMWKDMTSSKKRKIVLENILTNYKK